MESFQKQFDYFLSISQIARNKNFTENTSWRHLIINDIFVMKAGLEAEPVAAEAKVLPKRFTAGIIEFHVLLRSQASHESSLSYPESLF